MHRRRRLYALVVATVCLRICWASPAGAASEELQLDYAMRDALLDSNDAMVRRLATAPLLNPAGFRNVDGQSSSFIELAIYRCDPVALHLLLEQKPSIEDVFRFSGQTTFILQNPLYLEKCSAKRSDEIVDLLLANHIWDLANPNSAAGLFGQINLLMFRANRSPDKVHFDYCRAVHVVMLASAYGIQFKDVGVHISWKVLFGLPFPSKDDLARYESSYMTGNLYDRQGVLNPYVPIVMGLPPSTADEFGPGKQPPIHRVDVNKLKPDSCS